VARYSLLFKESVPKDLRSIPKRDLARILTRIRTLADEPRGEASEKLSGQERYRLRQGSYRILYEVHDDLHEIVVVKVGHRRDVTNPH
jgi:mRNA interferase RelE/StbE